MFKGLTQSKHHQFPASPKFDKRSGTSWGTRLEQAGPKRILAFVVGVAFVYYYVVVGEGLPPSGLSTPHSTFTSSWANTEVPANGLEETIFVAHAAGFSVIKNAYSHKGTWYFVSTRRWSYPELKYVLSNAPGPGEEARTTDKEVQILWPQEAKARGFENAEVVAGNTLIFNDRIFMNHYYHLIGEMFLGAWRVWESVALMNRSPNPPIDRLAFPNIDQKLMNDGPGFNKFCLEKFFPSATWEFKSDWSTRKDSGTVHRYEQIILADRKSGHIGPYTQGKPMDDSFALPVPEDWTRELRDAVVANNNEPPVAKVKKQLPVVTYLARQTAQFRRLKPEVHERILIEIKRLEKEGLAEVQLEEFSSEDAKEDQAAKIARTTILVGLHGNGLTHMMWMNPSPKSAVIEFQQKGMRMDDYSAISEALGIRHWIMNVDTRGADSGIRIGALDYDVDVNVLMDKLRNLLAA